MLEMILIHGFISWVRGKHIPLCFPFFSEMQFRKHYQSVLLYKPSRIDRNKAKSFFQNSILPEVNTCCIFVFRKLNFLECYRNIFKTRLQWAENYDLLFDPIHFFVTFWIAFRLPPDANLASCNRMSVCLYVLAMRKIEMASRLVPSLQGEGKNEMKRCEAARTFTY